VILKKKQLDDTSRIFLTLDNVRRANDRVVQYIDEMEISSIPETGFDQYYFDDKNDLLSRSTALCCSEIEFPYAIEHHLEKAALHEGLSKFIQKPPGKSEFIPHEDKEFNDVCASLLKNCILAWNYDYLSKIKQDTPDMDEILKYGFIPVWKHVAFSYR